MTRLTAAGIALQPPDRIAVRGKTVVVGRIGFSLLVTLREGPVAVEWVKDRLWNDPDAPAPRLKGAIHRLNVKLSAAGCYLRVSAERGVLILI